jgi:hypothetical protein
VLSVGGSASRQYDVAPDGEPFLMIKDTPPTVGGAPQQQLVIVRNWIEELKRLVPRN